MSATIVAYWPGITDKQISTQPGFHNDYQAWAAWIAEMEEESDAIRAIGELEAAAVLAYTTEGMENADVRWVTSQELQTAAGRLAAAVRRGDPQVEPILEVYSRNANGFDPIPQEFVRDLHDVETLARWAEEQSAARMTLEINW